ncbi:MAG: HAMP domain-containing protein [Nitrospirae bacterium]|nr:HAMP domain-containing protein [Nitrospirota bacterium]
MKRVLFRKVLFSYLIITAVLFIALEIYLSRVVRSNYISRLEESLLIQSRLIEEEIPRLPGSNLDDFCGKYKEKTGARVTIIDGTGRVIGDSDEVSEKMDNHSDRPEIKEALINKTGSSIRMSSTLHKKFFYFAIALGGNPERGFLRLSVPLHDLETAISDIRMRIAAASLIALLAAILIGLFQTGRITRSIEEITRFSAEIKSGDFRSRLFLKEKGELGELAKNINDMAQELKIRLEFSQKEQHKMEEILKNMSDGLMLTDVEGRIFLCNPAVKRFFGIDYDLEGRTLMETLRNVELMDVLAETVNKKETVSQEIMIAHPKEIYLLATAVPFNYPPESEKISGIVLSFHDVTRLKKLEDVRKDFVANVSHEIKTPVTAIKGFAETLLEGALDDRENAVKFLLTIKNHSERLNSLVEDLLTLSRIELGDIKIKKTAVDLDDVTDTVFTTLKNKAAAKGLQLIKDVPSDLHEIIADRNRLIQILLNLVDNGIKFTERGEVTVQVKSEKLKVKSKEKDADPSPVTRHSSPGDFIEISVSDTGVGIPHHHIPRLGERFYRVDRSRSRELGGTGLGLAIVKHLVKAHGWELRVESTPGRGTAVKIIIPA